MSNHNQTNNNDTGKQINSKTHTDGMASDKIKPTCDSVTADSAEWDMTLAPNGVIQDSFDDKGTVQEYNDYYDYEGILDISYSEDDNAQWHEHEGDIPYGLQQLIESGEVKIPKWAAKNFKNAKKNSPKKEENVKE